MKTHTLEGLVCVFCLSISSINWPGWGPKLSTKEREDHACRGRAPSVRNRRQIQSNRLRRRLGHPMIRVSHEDTCAFCALCTPLEADFAAYTGHSARAGVSWVGFSGLERKRDRALGGMSSPIPVNSPCVFKLITGTNTSGVGSWEPISG